MTDRAKKILVFSVATFAIAGLVASCAGLNEVGSRSNAESFQLSGLSVTPSEVAVGDEVVITTQVTNIGASDGTYNAELRINNVTEASDKVSVAAGKTETLTFVIFKEAPGTYRVTLGQLGGQFTVTESTATGTGNQTAAATGQTGGSCCATGKQSASPAPRQTGAGCCGLGTQSSPTAQPRRTSGGGCCQ